MPTLFESTASHATELSLDSFTFAHPLAIGMLALRARSGSIQLSNHTGVVSTFLSRIGFYDYAQIPDPHRIRKGGNIHTIEIRPADASQDAVYDRLGNLLKRGVSLRTLKAVLIELIGNVENHAEAEGIVLGQVVRNKVELVVIDQGIGIHRSLTSAAEYAQLNEQEAILRSLEKGVTNGRGAGFGLWSASTVLRANGGDLVLGSGRYQYSLSSGRVTTGPGWNGTYVLLTYDLTNPVDYTALTGLAQSLQDEHGNEFDIPF